MKKFPIQKPLFSKLSIFMTIAVFASFSLHAEEILVKKNQSVTHDFSNLDIPRKSNIGDEYYVLRSLGLSPGDKIKVGLGKFFTDKCIKLKQKETFKLEISAIDTKDQEKSSVPLSAALLGSFENMCATDFDGKEIALDAEDFAKAIQTKLPWAEEGRIGIKLTLKLGEGDGVGP